VSGSVGSGLENWDSQWRAICWIAATKLTIYNRTRSKAEPLAERGAQIAAKPLEVAGKCGLVVSVLWDSDTTESCRHTRVPISNGRWRSYRDVYRLARSSTKVSEAARGAWLDLRRSACVWPPGGCQGTPARDTLRRASGSQEQSEAGTHGIGSSHTLRHGRAAGYTHRAQTVGELSHHLDGTLPGGGTCDC
jgi:hypothetical protein